MSRRPGPGIAEDREWVSRGRGARVGGVGVVWHPSTAFVMRGRAARWHRPSGEDPVADQQRAVVGHGGQDDARCPGEKMTGLR